VQDRYRIGNAQTIGFCQVQSNYFSTRNGQEALAVLADGTIDHINGRRCAILAVEACMRKYFAMLSGEAFMPDFDTLVAGILRELRDYIYCGKMPNLSLSILFFRGQEVIYYTVGRNQAFLFDGKDYKILEGRNGRASFGGGMTAGVVSAGVWQVLQEMEFISYLKKREHPFDKAQWMIQGVMEKRKKGAGNATVLLVEDAL
jgi:hypothetical protein